eukprot:scaffold31090_cov66-Skeletonema_marinoi.AAC.1
MTQTKELPPSILRRQLCPRQQQPPHWPKRQRVHFADGPRRKISSSPPSRIGRQELQEGVQGANSKSKVGSPAIAAKFGRTFVDDGYHRRVLSAGENLDGATPR